MIHLGTIPNNYGNETKLTDKVLIAWELPTLLYEHEETEYSSVISKEYTLTLGSKGNLRKDLESWRGKAFTETEADNFDLTKLLGVPCMLNVIHKVSGSGVTYANISSVSKLPQGLDCPKSMRAKFEFNYDDKYSTEAIEDMPEFIRSKIKSSQEYMAKIGGNIDPQTIETAPVETIPPPQNGDDDLPF